MGQKVGHLKQERRCDMFNQIKCRDTSSVKWVVRNQIDYSTGSKNIQGLKGCINTGKQGCTILRKKEKAKTAG